MKTKTLKEYIKYFGYDICSKIREIVSEEMTSEFGDKILEMDEQSLNDLDSGIIDFIVDNLKKIRR